MLQPMEEMILPPKRQAVVDRLRRRIETYRRRQTECVPRFDQSFSGACEQQNLETSALQKRFLEGKAKRQAKKSDRKPDLPAISGNLHSSVHVQQKFGCGDYEPPAKLQCVGGGAGSNAGVGGEALTKFSVEIVQQLEFTTSAADSQPQQISTNVTVKALANAVKTSSSPPPAQQRPPTPLDCERECKAECKSEVADDEFGLDECAAALERDAAAAFPRLADFLGEDDGDDITSIEDLITQISEYPEFIMKDFELDNGKFNVDGNLRDFSNEMSPAAQTLKHMAEQHQAGSGEWGRYRMPSPHGPPPSAQFRPRPDLHIDQHQHMHLNQPHHNLQVSAAQHMQVNGSANHVSVAAQQGMYANFSHHNAPPSNPHHQGSSCPSYSVSQSQNINFSQQGRGRSAPGQMVAGNPQSEQVLLGVAGSGLNSEQQAKMLQQQQQSMLRAQHQQQGMRPPPPEYKARMSSVRGVGVPGPRPPRPYCPEWRQLLIHHHQSQRSYSHHHTGGFGMSPMGAGLSQQQQMQIQQARLQQQQLMQHHSQQRSQSQQSPMTHLLMQQNQMMNVQGQMSNIHMSQSQSMAMQGGMGSMGGGHQGNPMQGQNGPMPGQNGPMQGQNGPMQGQNGPMQGQTCPMPGQTSHMQNQNASMQSGPMPGQNGPMGGQATMHQSQSMQHNMMSQNSMPNNSNNSFPSVNTSPFTGQPTDFNLDFLDNMASSDSNNMTAQDLLNSLDNSFLNDIL